MFYKYMGDDETPDPGKMFNFWQGTPNLSWQD